MQTNVEELAVKQAMLRARWVLYALVPTFLVFLTHTSGKRWF